MRRLMLMAVVGMACNYYGPGNPPPDVDAKFTYRIVEKADPSGVAEVFCPSGYIAVGGATDCVLCTPTDSSAWVFGTSYTYSAHDPSVPANGIIGGCALGCAHVTVQCVVSDVSGTLTQALMDSDTALDAYRAARQAQRAR